MKRFFTSKFIAIAALATAALGAATGAQARPDVFFSIGLPVPPIFVDPRPVFAPPAPVYVQPAPVYVEPRPVYVQPPSYRPDFERERAWRRAEWQRQEWQRQEWQRREWERRDHDGRRFPGHGHGHD